MYFDYLLFPSFIHFSTAIIAFFLKVIFNALKVEVLGLHIG